jgi:hypothetical protein
MPMMSSRSWSHFVRATCMVGALSACKGRDHAPAATKGVDPATTAVAVEVGATPSSTAPAGAARAPSAATAPSPRPAAIDGTVRGPFRTIEAYCDDVLNGLRAEDCAESPNDIPPDPRSGMCSCEAATSEQLDGPVAIKKNANDVVLGAAVLRVSRRALDYVQCEVAVETDEGWFVVPEVFACAEVPVSDTPGRPRVAVRRLTIDETKNGANVTLRWQSTLEAAGAGTASCTYRSPGPPVCSRAGARAARR